MLGSGTSRGGARFDALACWLSAKSTLLLMLLMVQLGLLVALAALVSAASTHSGVAVSRGERAKCGAFEVIFTPGADLASVRQWALNFDAQIVAGPNARGAFELSVPQLGVDELRQALGPLAEQVRANPLCPAASSS